MLLNRKTLGAFALLTLSSCGFTPLYGGPHGRVATNALETVQVQNMPERAGQMVRLKLQQDFYRNGPPVQALYTLTVYYWATSTLEGIQQDSSSTRERFTGTAVWVLSPIGSPDQVLVKGNATAMDALNIIDQQYFSMNLETSTVNQQLADEISEQITTQLAAWFHTHPQP